MNASKVAVFAPNNPLVFQKKDYYECHVEENGTSWSDVFNWEKYNSSNGKYQEELGPAEAIKLLNRLNYDEALIERVAYLVGHHHTYSEIDGLDYQILVEADFLVNLFESESEEMAINSAYQKIFKTNMGKRICRTMFMKG